MGQISNIYEVPLVPLYEVRSCSRAFWMIRGGDLRIPGKLGRSATDVNDLDKVDPK
jgi:hypothetical protein